ncbi:hypothetical protein CI610_02920 [invertebrate metagenome]|uniref:Uncharacterized protein n=1 Tax=invertebrate metagenome TaxID=1711999 RepID=A0A2H9T4K5_9ZZZZ
MDFLLEQTQLSSIRSKEWLTIPNIDPRGHRVKCFFNCESSSLQLFQADPKLKQQSYNITYLCKQTLHYFLSDIKQYQQENFLMEDGSEAKPDASQFIFLPLSEKENMSEPMHEKSESHPHIKKTTENFTPSSSVHYEKGLVIQNQQKSSITQTRGRKRKRSMGELDELSSAPAVKKSHSEKNGDTTYYLQNEKSYSDTEMYEYIKNCHKELHHSLLEIAQEYIDEDSLNFSLEKVSKVLIAYKNFLGTDNEIHSAAGISDSIENIITRITQNPLCQLYFLTADHQPVTWRDIVLYMSHLQNTWGHFVPPQELNYSQSRDIPTKRQDIKIHDALKQSLDNLSPDEQWAQRLQRQKMNLIDKLKKLDKLKKRKGWSLREYNDDLTETYKLLKKHETTLQDQDEKHQKKSIIACKMIHSCITTFYKDVHDKNIASRDKARKIIGHWFCSHHIELVNKLLGTEWFKHLSPQWTANTRIIFLQTGKQLLLTVGSPQTSSAFFKLPKATFAFFMKTLNLPVLLEASVYKRPCLIRDAISDLQWRYQREHPQLHNNNSFMKLQSAFLNAGNELQPITPEEAQALQSSANLSETTTSSSETAPSQEESVNIDGNTLDFSAL